MITPIPALKTRWVDPQIGARMVVVTDGVGVDVVVLEVDLRVDLPMDRRGEFESHNCRLYDRSPSSMSI